MRDALASLVDQRIRVIGMVGRLSVKPSGRPSCILREVTDEAGTPLCDHLWLPFTKSMAASGVAMGTTLAVTGTVRPYTKPHSGVDYDLRYLTRPQVLMAPAAPPPLPTGIDLARTHLGVAQNMIGQLLVSLADLQEAAQAGQPTRWYAALIAARAHGGAAQEAIRGAARTFAQVQQQAR